MTEIDLNRFDEFVLKNQGDFLQSSDWGKFQTSLSKKVYYFLENNCAGLFIENNLPLGQKYWYCPRGPIFEDEKNNQVFLQQVIAEAKKNNVAFLRLEPIKDWALNLKRVKDVQPSQVAILNLDKSEAELLNSFHPKTRYNIGLAVKKGVTVRTLKTAQDVEIFWQILNKTYSRQDIRTHDKSYYAKLLASNYQNFSVKLYLAEYQKTPIAANLIYYFNGIAYYAHGGTDYNYRQLMAPQLLQWVQIQDAKQAGCKVYDFWGYDEKKWPGVSRFKKGFNPQIINYPGTFDLVINKPLYLLYTITRSIRRLTKA